MKDSTATVLLLTYTCLSIDPWIRKRGLQNAPSVLVLPQSYSKTRCNLYQPSFPFTLWRCGLFLQKSPLNINRITWHQSPPPYEKNARHLVVVSIIKNSALVKLDWFETFAAVKKWQWTCDIHCTCCQRLVGINVMVCTHTNVKFYSIEDNQQSTVWGRQTRVLVIPHVPLKRQNDIMFFWPRDWVIGLKFPTQN